VQVAGSSVEFETLKYKDYAFLTAGRRLIPEYFPCDTTEAPLPPKAAA